MQSGQIERFPALPTLPDFRGKAMVVVLLFAIMLVLTVSAGWASPSDASADAAERTAVSTVTNVGDVVISAPCTAPENETDPYHTNDHCTVSCSPHVGWTPASELFRWPGQSELNVLALASPPAPRSVAPDPFPPRVFENA